MTESPGKKSRRLERMARDAVDAAKDDRSADAVNLVEAGVAEDAQAFALHLLGIAAQVERPTPARSSLWRLWGWALVLAAFAVEVAVALALSWVRPGAWLACAPEVGSRLLQGAMAVGFGWRAISAARLLSGALAVLARLEGGKSNPVWAVVGESKGLGTVLEALDGTGGWIELRADIGKPQRYTEGQEVAVYGPLRAGAVVAVSATSGVRWSRVKRTNPVGARRAA